MHHRGFAPVLILLVSVILIALAAGFFFIQTRTKLAGIKNFDDCIQAGYPALMSYPEQCNTPDGHHFVQQLTGEEKNKLNPPTPLPTTDTAGWKTYTGETIYSKDGSSKFSIKYPPSWDLVDNNLFPFGHPLNPNQPSLKATPAISLGAGGHGESTPPTQKSFPAGTAFVWWDLKGGVYSFQVGRYTYIFEAANLSPDESAQIRPTLETMLNTLEIANR